tara:strand:- start:18 stop:593 length:576 start_codon:yes stop_codon:yes gene_type:complete
VGTSGSPKEPNPNKELFNKTVEKIKELNKKYRPLFDNLKNVDRKDRKRERKKLIEQARPEIKKILDNFGGKYNIKSEIDLIKSPAKSYESFSLVKDYGEIIPLLKMYRMDTVSTNYTFLTTKLNVKLGEINKFILEKFRYSNYIDVNKLIKEAKNKTELNKIRTRINKDDFPDLGKYESILLNEIEKAKKN